MRGEGSAPRPGHQRQPGHRGRGRTGAVRELVRALPPLGLPARARPGPSPTSSPACPTWRLGIDVLYLPPVHPIGTTDRKGHDGDARPPPATPAAPGPSVARGGHTASTRTWARWPISSGWSRPAAWDRRRARPGVPVLAGPSLGTSTPSGSVTAPMAPSVRREPAQAVRGHLPVRLRDRRLAELWQALLDVVRFWIDHGVTVFRVDNPHTKPFAFWEWLIASVRAEHPDDLPLRGVHATQGDGPAGQGGLLPVLHVLHLANTKWELETYMAELTAPVADYFRPTSGPTRPTS